ncbi:MAG: Gfo/Idh/MocA family oxidoreductase [Lentisphaeria bacterium]|nr:Gfo/Idh/MocA family oxidoreductase [Lentisphaeria bacterium]
MERLRIGLWGIGRAGWGMHCKEIGLFPDLLEISGCCDEIPERMARMRAAYPGCRSFPDIDSMIASKEVEVIVVAIRSPDHVSGAVRALEGGKYVFLEKPIAVNEADLSRLIAADAAYPGRLFCRQNRRFEAAFQHVKQIIDSGVLGDVFLIKLSRLGYARRRDWQTLTEFGGGQLNNWGPHLVDHALRFINAPVKSVWADMRRIAASGDAEDHVKAVIRGENGVVVDIEISAGAALPCPVYAVYGSCGALRADDEKTLKLRYLDREKTAPPQPADPATPPMDGKFSSGEGLVWIEKEIPVAPASNATVNDIYRYLFSAIRVGVPFPIRNSEAFETARIIGMIRRAAGQ